MVDVEYHDKSQSTSHAVNTTLVRDTKGAHSDQHFNFFKSYFNVFQRILIFLIGCMISFRFVHPYAYGTAYVSLDLLEGVSLALLREGFRRTALRMPDASLKSNDSNHWQAWWKSAQAVSRLACRTIVALIIVIVALLNIKVLSQSSNVLVERAWYFPCFCLATCIASLGTIATVLIEDKVVLLLTQDPFCRAKASVWTSSFRRIFVVIFYCFILYRFPNWKDQFMVEIGLICYGFGQFVNGISFVAYFYYMCPPVPDLHPETCKNLLKESNTATLTDKESGEMLSGLALKLLGQDSIPEHRSTLILFCWNSLLKLLLNETERLTLLMLFPVSSWVTYGFVSRVGGLLSRFVFSSMEEAVGVKCSSSMTESNRCVRRDSTFYIMIQCMLGWFILCFGPPLTSSLFTLVLGKQWISLGAHLVSSVYCYYLFLISVNGVLEAFMYAKASPKTLRRLNLIFPAISLSGLTACIFFKHMVSQMDSGESNSFHSSPLREVHYTHSLIKGSIVAVLLRLSFSGTFFITKWAHEDLDKPKYHKKRNMSRLSSKLVFQKILSLLILSLPFLIPCAVGGIILRLILYRESRLHQRLFTKIFLSQDAPSTIMGIALFVTFFLNRHYFFTLSKVVLKKKN